MARKEAPTPILCFVHIERGGGTTLHAILRNNHPFGYMPLTPRSIWANEETNVFTLNEARYLFKLFPFVKGFGGHTVRTYIPYESALHRPIRYITFLRDPVARYISHYNYHRKMKKIHWDLNGFLEERRLHNFITKRIAGCPDVERAKKQLAERMSFVGLTDRFDESLVLMKAELGLGSLNILYEKQNTSRDPNYWKDPELENETTLERIRAVNTLDRELYEFAKTELYPAYVARFGSGLEDEVAKLRQANAGFRFPIVRRACWTMYRHIGYRNLERILSRAFRSHKCDCESIDHETDTTGP